MASDHGLAMPLNRLEAVWGVDHEGETMLVVTWTSHGTRAGEKVDHLTKAGMLALIQEGIRADDLEVLEAEWEAEDGTG